MSCPPREELQRLLDELLSAEEGTTLSLHVAECPDCQAALDRLTRDEFPNASSSLSCALPTGSAAFLERLKEDPPWKPHRRTDRHAPDDHPLPTIPGYEVLELLGRGGMGVVYQARQINLRRLVALKVILHGPHARAQELDRFRQETEAVARLRHPNIVQIYDVGEVNGVPYCALEYIEGGSLADRLRGDPQPLAVSARLVETLARAVHHAHQVGILHRDLKPANVLLSGGLPELVGDPGKARDADGGSSTLLESVVPKLTDFGLAKRLDDVSERTHTGEILGTPSYMAPEQAGLARRALGPATDVYSLGAILYELITGRPPFKGPTAFETILQVVHEEPVRPGSLRPGLPRDLETICLACLSKDPARRYPSALHLATDLRSYLQGRPILTRPTGPLERAWKWARRKPLIAGLVAGMLLMALAGFSGISWQWREAAQARDAALEEKREKEQERQEAELARAAAVEAQVNEADQRQRARTALYFSRIAQSELAWRANDYPGARQALARCRPGVEEEEQRGWEWYYLEGLHHTYLHHLRHGRPGAGGWVAFSQDGNRVIGVVGGDPLDESAAPAEMRAWDAQTGRTLFTRQVPPAMHRLMLAPGGKYLALGGTDGSLALWDLQTVREITRFKAHDGSITGIAFSPDGRTVATAGWDECMKTWEVPTGKLRRAFPRLGTRIQSVAFHPDGERLATAGWDGKIHLWHQGQDEPVLAWPGHKGPIFCVSFSPDGKRLASASRNGTLKTWEVNSGRGLQSLTGNAGAILCVVWSPDAQFLGYGGGDSTVRVWEVEAGEERIILRGHTAPVEGVAFSPDGRRMVTCTPTEGVVKIWDVTRHPEQATLARTGADVEAVAFDRSGSVVLSVTVGGIIQHWHSTTGLPQSEVTVPLCARVVSPARIAAFDSQGERLAGRWNQDGRMVKIWDAGTGKELTRLEGHSADVRAVRFSPDGRLIGTASFDSTITGQAMPPHEIAVWDATTSRRLHFWKGRGRVYNLAFDPTGQRMAWGGEGGLIGLVDLESPEARVLLSRHRGSVIALAFGREGTQLATASMEDRTVNLWRITPGTPLGLQMRFSMAAPPLVSDLDFSPDNRRLAGGSRDVVKVWDLESGQEVLTLRGAAQRHWDPPFNPRVLFSPSGTQLVGTNWNETISLWHAEMVEDGGASSRQQRRRKATEARGTAWHLEQAEHCLELLNLPGACFHTQRLLTVPVPDSQVPRLRRLQQDIGSIVPRP
ncbi:MAG: protein kinase [Gemmataceae bacterium]